MRKIKIGLTNTFKLNSLELKPFGNYKVSVDKKEKGTLLNKETYKVGIYKGSRVVISKQKIYDNAIFLEGKTGKEMLEINGHKYRGDFTILVEKNNFKVINHVNLEEYLYGVIGKEISHTWPEEAIRAQAVIARTYTLQNLDKHKQDGYDLTDTPSSQVYGGVDAEYENIDKAVDQTEGEVVVFGSKMASVYYHSTCGGYTENARNVWGTEAPLYLMGRRCSYCKDAASFKWDATLKFSDIKAALDANGYKTGDINQLKVRRYLKSGRIKDISILWEGGASTISANDFRRIFANDLKSTMFEITLKSDSIYLKGKGFGHGVGMCQFGSKEMAEKGSSYKEIIKFYFPKTELKQWQKI